MDKKEAEETEPKRPADNARVAVARGEKPKDAPPPKHKPKQPPKAEPPSEEAQAPESK